MKTPANYLADSPALQLATHADRPPRLAAGAGHRARARSIFRTGSRAPRAASPGTAAATRSAVARTEGVTE